MHWAPGVSSQGSGARKGPDKLHFSYARRETLLGYHSTRGAREKHMSAPTLIFYYPEPEGVPEGCSEGEEEGSSDLDDFSFLERYKSSMCCRWWKPKQAKLKQLVDHRYFQRGILTAILVNTLSMGIEYHNQRILFRDEAHFWLNRYVNKQNCRIWSEANPQVYVETPLHPEKLTVWCALWAGGIIGSYFFKNDEGHNVTVNGDRYRAMITNFFIPELKNHDVQELRFQQDGATCHTARATIDLLKDTFGDRLISRFGPVNWPPRSCDLTPLDYFL
ncbi:transposable element Tc3 transposase [Trichonephila clavipes]|nr:transposable element Tc3 transposase [Trichonephila clavipes]